MSKRYPGGVIRKTPATPTQSSASGVWGMTDVTQAQQTNNWPVANVPNPMSRSLRFRASASAYLNRTPATATNRKTWTWSAWVKRGTLSTSQVLLSAGGSSSPYQAIYLQADNTLAIEYFNNPTNYYVITTQVFRDPSAWYHIVMVWDTTQATDSNRVKIYVNGVQVTAFAAAVYPTQNLDGYINNNQATTTGCWSNSVASFFDGYMAEVNFVDGQALTATSFGQYDQFSNWTSKKYTGTYGTNGFYLPFSNNSSTGTLGLDFSGNNNTWTTNNISLTAGTTYDSMVDVPTQWTPYNVTGDVGGIIRGNYAVLNPLAINYGITAGYYTMSNGNLFASATGTEAFASTTIQMESGKYYAEFYVNLKSSTSISQFGIATLDLVDTRVYRSDGNYNAGAGNVAYGATYTTGDTVAVAVDITNNTIEFYKNGTSQGQKTGISTAGKSWFFWIYSGGGNSSWYANYGQYAFTYAPPSGYKSLCTTNLPTPTIQQGNLVMDATTYTGTGNGVSQTITNAGSSKPDLVWVKARGGVADHVLFDSIRGFGGNKELSTNNTQSEGQGDTSSYGYVSSANSNGFTVTAGSVNAGYVNSSGIAYVGWQWQAGQGTTSSNTSGSITSTVSVNQTAGFSIVTYTGNGNGASTIGHGLGVAPSWVITKNRSSSDNWIVYFSINGTKYYSQLNLTNAASSTTGYTAPTSTVFNPFISLGSGDNYVAYCWAAVTGYSAFGSYVGTGTTNGVFVYTGFRPKFVMIKVASGQINSTSWNMFDTSRSPYNLTSTYLQANDSGAEGSDTFYAAFDILSNGFKLRSVNTYGINQNNATYIYMAFAEYPFKSALAR